MIWLMPWDEDHPSRHAPWATWSLLALNLLAFGAVVVAGYPAGYAPLYDEYGLIAAEPRWYQFLTSSFMHGGVWHLLGNMLFLFVFGDNVEDLLGPAGMLLLYFIGGLAGDLMFVSANPALLTPSVGASGCISTLAGAYAVMFFRNRIGVRLMLLVFPVYTFYLRAFWLLLLWFGFDVYQTLATRGTMEGAGGVNFVAHGVGFAIGFGVGVFAWLHGVLRRFEKLPQGHAWFGYWPSQLEDRKPRRVLRKT